MIRIAGPISLSVFGQFRFGCQSFGATMAQSAGNNQMRLNPLRPNYGLRRRIKRDGTGRFAGTQRRDTDIETAFRQGITKFAQDVIDVDARRKLTSLLG